MLIRNRSTVERFIRIRLDFDNGTTKRCDLKKGDMGHFVFRWNDRLIREFGRVADIVEGVHYKLPPQKKNDTVFIILDSSHSLDSERYKISLNDLVDIDIVPDVEFIGPERGKMSMKIISDKKCKRRCGTWPILRPRNEKRSKK